MADNYLFLMNSSIECNNAGVAFLQTGRTVEALEAFKVAAQLLYHVSKSFHIYPPWVSNPLGTPSTLSAAIIAELTTFQAAQKHPAQCHQPVQQSGETSVTSFEGGLRIDPTADNGFTCLEPMCLDHVTEFPCSCAYEAAAILFNMGLSYQSFGTGQNLSRALYLFEMAFSLGQIIQNDSRAPQVAMASVNNTACIYHSLGNYRLSRYCLDVLASFILGLPPARNDDLRKERLEYLLNTVLLQRPDNAGAA